MLKFIRRKAKKFFREFLLYHNSSLEYRAKIFTLMVAANKDISSKETDSKHTGSKETILKETSSQAAANKEISACEKELLMECACEIYKNDEERCEILLDTIQEYFDKIITKNGLDFEHLIFQVEKETRDNKRFSEKINLEILLRFHSCARSEDHRLYQLRVIEFLEDLKKRYG